MNKITISRGNMKVGSIPNFSLTPGLSCSDEACRKCFQEGCYARKAYRMYPTVRKAWDNNLDMAVNHLDELEDLLNSELDKLQPRFFRVHVAGDFVTQDYTLMWCRVAANHPNCKFLAFTKQWDNIRGIDFPSNFNIVLSDWSGTEIPSDLRLLYHVAWVDDGRPEIPTDISQVLECPGSCENCGMCWQLNFIDRDVKFHKH